MVITVRRNKQSLVPVMPKMPRPPPNRPPRTPRRHHKLKDNQKDRPERKKSWTCRESNPGPLPC
ncbi:hypothetical protein HBH69_002840 [Parastagonospora nodorum]|nr:hypothetical protein HBI95_172490 [Parastagonospora nodorum]KAH4203960.1 hypothetical protein HBH42_008040 [Parastagonospora nodorum]KAH4236365.1 hypothetical protein HBI05_136120 [Parastagonospora nodorum]KAH4242109.1 hypothetical protein HBI06_016040 [Parastagonospora nodorum]KAH4819459.1 hypothetical protein HBH61_030160 [Parastagonospora nodorum]